MQFIDEIIRSAMMRGDRCFLIMEDDFYKVIVYGEDLKMKLVHLTPEDVLREIKNMMKPNWC